MFEKIYGLLIAEYDLRKSLHFGPYCGPITFLVSMLLVILVSCTLASSSMATSDEKVLGVFRSETWKRMPRKESVVGLRPAYKCIRKHVS
ncbi:hypothetical protein KPH14_001658 [Odynerus spinipes]|uniref:Uncharacterized protein n=1 Tax=Odynerus spinipes TaxID=1348599 RepID=A0AAD9S033_9HYME|nr:hypothetical protein KPH14_001658 [Odynerus spinipes]